jgi:hypothetical protein
MATKKTTPTKKRRTSAREPLLREVDAIDFQTLWALAYYPSISPIGDGQMPLSAAVHWIASKGFKNDHDLTSQEGQLAYSAAAIDLFAKISSDNKVHAVGENSDEDPEQLPAVQFSELASYFDFTDDFEAAGNDRRMEINVSEEGYSRDVLRKAGKRGQWTAVRVSCEDVRRVWPYQGLPRCDDNSPEEFCDAVPSEIQKGPKAEITRQALRSKFRDGLVPKHLSTTKICERIKPEMLKLGDNGGADRSTVERLLKRRK